MKTFLQAAFYVGDEWIHKNIVIKNSCFYTSASCHIRSHNQLKCLKKILFTTKYNSVIIYSYRSRPVWLSFVKHKRRYFEEYW